MSDDFDLETFLPYLLNQAAEATSRSFEAAYRARHGMTRTQWRVLANLGKFGTMTATRICRISHIEKTKVSRAVAALEERGLLARHPDPQDRRAETLSLTADGRELFGQLGALALDHDRRLRSSLGPQLATVVVGALQALIRSAPGKADLDDLT